MLLAGVLFAAIAPARADFAACMAGLRPAAAKAGVSSATFNAALRGVAPDMKILELLDNQPEFKTPIWDYIAPLVDEERVSEGRAGMRQHGSALQRASARYGVDPATIAAVWGVESNFGQNLGSRPLIESLATLSCYGRRQSYFRTEFIATLRILQRGDMRASQLTGSWAGAFGQTQFMPSTFLSTAVDLDGDGRADIVDSVPDALGSTANFLKKAGWRTGLPWGFEVVLPAGYSGPTGRRNKRSMEAWAAAGIRRVDGRRLGGGTAGLLLPAGRAGPAFLVTRNFDALYSYNAAESYALAIAHLSDRLRGGGPFVTPWPTDDPPLSRAQRRELQALLIRRGYDVGGQPDGVVGTMTRRAISDYQRRIGLNPDGRAGGKVLNALKAGR